MSWGWGVVGVAAAAVGTALLIVRPEVVGPSVSRFVAPQLLILGLLLVLMAIWRGVTIGFVVLGILLAIANIALAVYGSFVLPRCGWDGASAFAVWRTHAMCNASIGAKELEKWAIVGGFGVLLIVVAAYALRSFRRRT